MTNDEIDWDSLREVVSAYERNVTAEVRARWDAWEIGLSRNEVHEVVGGLLARQATLAIHLVGSPSIWNQHVAPVLLRSMGDVYINLAWILGKPEERSQRFIHYGLGQMKLQIEHHKARWGDEKPKATEVKLVEAMETWVESQQHSFLTEVNVGSWSGLSTRAMAEEAGVSDFYKFSYTPFSATVHSSWSHVSIYNLKSCSNPLHCDHHTPTIADASNGPFNAITAAKYFSKCMLVFDETFDIHVEVVDSYRELHRTLVPLFTIPEDETATEEQI